MYHSKFAFVITIISVVLILAIIGGTWSPVSAQKVTGSIPKKGGGGGGEKGDNAGCPVESGCINGLPITGAAPLQAELPWALVLIPLTIASLGAFTYNLILRKKRQLRS